MQLRSGLLGAALLAACGGASAQGNLVLYCGNVEDHCRAMVTAFERKTGIKVAMTRKSSGEIYAHQMSPRGFVASALSWA